MKLSSSLVSFASVISVFGMTSISARDSSVCDGIVVSNSTITVGDRVVEIATVHCPDVVEKRGIFFPWIPFPNPKKNKPTAHTPTPASSTALPAATPTPQNVCDEICIDECSNSGPLPPTTEDCETIVDAITILNGSTEPTFDVDSNNVKTLSFGTCRFFFENFSPNPLTYCWTSLATQASAAESACLPPVQPVNSEGFCLAADGTWQVGVAHS